MKRCFQVDLKIKDDAHRAIAFDAMKKMQQDSNIIDEGVTISFHGITLTAGFYDNIDDFDDLFISIFSKDKESIRNHVKNYFPNIQDSDVRNDAINNICESLRHCSDARVTFNVSEIEELRKLSVGNTKRKNMK